MMTARGIAARILESPSGAPPAVYGELLDARRDEDRRLLRALRRPAGRHDAVDHAAVAARAARQGRRRGRTDDSDPDDRWARSRASGGMYARSASDDKAPALAMLAAIDALKAAGVPPSVNLKLFFEGEEEAGSGHLRRTAREERRRSSRADAWLFGDGPVHQSRRQQIVFGVRGVTGVELTAYGPSHGLHSGHYGNWAPNPVTMLANFIASMRNDDGRILIKNFYDDVAPITPAERRAHRRHPGDRLRRCASKCNSAPRRRRMRRSSSESCSPR